MDSLLSTPIAATTFLVLDVETTGFIRGRDQIVEIAAVVVTAVGEPKVALNTIIRPSRRMGGTDIHGLTDADVVDAPRIADLAEPLRALMANRVLAAHNSSFDVPFIQEALGDYSGAPPFPYLCTMGINGLLGLGSQYPLSYACGYFGIELGTQHAALDDAIAAARLLQHLVRELANKKISTFGQLVSYDRHRSFFDSFSRPFLPAPSSLFSESSIPQKPRRKSPPEKASRLREYLNLVLQQVADLQVSDVELSQTIARRDELGILPEEMRAIHARVFGGMISRYSEDRRIDDLESSYLRRLRDCLDALGWAPGS